MICPEHRQYPRKMQVMYSIRASGWRLRVYYCLGCGAKLETGEHTHDPAYKPGIILRLGRQSRTNMRKYLKHHIPPKWRPKP